MALTGPTYLLYIIIALFYPPLSHRKSFDTFMPHAFQCNKRNKSHLRRVPFRLMVAVVEFN